MNTKEIQEIETKIKKIENKIEVAEAKADGLTLTIVEGQPGRYSVVRENYDKDNKANKKLNRLTR